VRIMVRPAVRRPGEAFVDSEATMPKSTQQAKSTPKRAAKKRANAKSPSRGRNSSTGAVVYGFHEGSRSEILADYLFSAWGTVTPVRRQSDYGLDLYCTLTEQVGQRARVREYFSVQVKSDSAPWSFSDAESVKWLVGHPLPLFLSMVDKKEGVVRVYHTIPRFQIWALPPIPDRVELIPGYDQVGEFDPCANLPRCRLSAPILQIALPDLTDQARMEELRNVFAYWVTLDRENCEFVRAGLLRFRRPHGYKTNELPFTNTQLDLSQPRDEDLQRGLLRLAEAIECIGGQLARRPRDNRAFGLEAALLLDRIQREFPDVFKGNPFWNMRVPGNLNQYVVSRLRQTSENGYLYSGLDAVEAALADIPLVKQYLT